MKNFYNKLGAIAIATSIFFGINQDAEAAKRRVVVEDHTGAWCGWCPRGTQTLRELSEEFGEDFIPVAIHNGDAMAYSEIQTPLAQKIGLTGYPSGSVNRMLFSGQSRVAMSDGAWSYYTNQIFDTPSMSETWADVDVEWTVSQNGLLSAVVTVTADAAASGQYGINLFVMEDGVTGTGNQYNQQNYLSGRSGFEGHYYYDKPAVITGYVHDNVLRYMLSGFDGKSGGQISKTTIAAGDVFQKSFEQNISSRIQNVDNVWVVAVIQNLSDSNFEIVNAKMDGKVLPLVAKVDMANDGDVANKHEAGEEVTEMVTITNPNDFEIDVNLSLNESTSIVPNGWTVEFSKNKVTIPAGGSATESVILKTGNTAGFAQYTVRAEVESTEEYKGKSSDNTFYSLSNSTENLVLVVSSGIMSPILTSFANNPVAQNSAVIPYSDDLLSAYPIEDFEFSYISIDFGSRSRLGANADFATSITNALQAGKKVLISTVLEAYWATGTGINFNPPAAPEATNLFRNVLGVETGSTSQLIQPVARNSNGQVTQVYTVPLVGVDSDPLFSGMNLTLNRYTQTHQYYTAYIDRFNITNPTTTEAIAHYNISGINKNESIAAVKVTLPSGGKAILTGFTFEILENASERSTLINKSIEWLMKEESSSPGISLSTESMAFGKVETEKTMAFQILNTGDADLEISSIEVTNDVDGAFSVIYDPTKSVVEAGKSLSVDVVFTPILTKASTGQLTITSNAGTKTVALAGESSVLSVDNYLANTGLFTMSVNPNPVSSQSVFTYELNSESAEQVSLQLVDLKGNVVAELFNGIQTPGSHTIDLNANNYANGQYFIIANLLGHNARFNVVIAK